MNTKPVDSKKLTVFFDFDNTITTYDVIDDMLIRFSKDDKWKMLEKKWRDGSIGSRECLRGQIKGIKITKKDLDGYLSDVEIDPYFKKTLELLKSMGIKMLVLSDNFDYILKTILGNNGINGVETHSNRLGFGKSGLVPRFPFTGSECSDCGNCKKAILLREAKKGFKSAYIGDGRSDICAAEQADIVFAKDDLLAHFRSNNLDHIPFDNLEDVYSYFKENLS